MKVFSLLFLIAFLASCGTSNIEPQTTTTENEPQVNEMESEMQEFENETMDEEKMETIEYSYTNPKQEVNMTISYTTDEKGKISAVNVESADYDLSNFNTAISEKIMGLTLEEASEVSSVSGSSLTTEAFKEAIKTQL